MIISERDQRDEQALVIAKQMLVAARTAPNGKGVDLIEAFVATGEEKDALADYMETLAPEQGMFFVRDAGCVRSAQAVVLIGTRAKVQGLNCAHCGFATCAEKPQAVPCEINSVDVGIALGSAASCAADARVDSRILYSAGFAAQKRGLLGEDVRQVFAIPISISSKSPFFDRASTRPAH